MNPLAKPLDYVILLDKWKGSIGRISEPGYDAPMPNVGEAIAYCNLFDQRDSYDKDTNTGDYGPYLSPTDTAEEYDEGVIDPEGGGWLKNINEQLTRARDNGFRYIEWDNCDAYAVRYVIDAIRLAAGFDLKVIAKNPGLMEGGAVPIVEHQNIYGIIIERGAGRPSEMDALRKAARKPDLPCWFVSFGSGRGWANDMAAEAKSYANMYVTYSSAGEYGSSIDIGTTKPLPSIFEPGANIPNLGNDMAWRLAKSLETLRDQVNAKWPGRDKSNDGTIGDAAHAAGTSDHNPNSANVVTAIDITHDPSRGLDARKLAEQLVASRDQRIKYIISNAQIISSLVQPWVWRSYSGSNAHRAHVHISVMAEPLLYDNTAPWELTSKVAPARASSVNRFTDIVATEFGGRGDPNNSAYDEHFIDDDEFGVALPFRFKGERPAVRVFKDGKSVVCEIVDVGPWNINDPYWDTGSRPQAETGIDNTGRRTNKAGIDLTPLAARTIGLNGLGKVDWEFVSDEPVIIPPPRGNPMPSEPTKFNAAVEDAIDEIRPILTKRFAALQAAAPTSEQALDDIIIRLGGTPPKRSPPLLPPPATGGTTTTPPTTSEAPASTTASTVAKNAAGGLLGIVAAALAWYNGGMTDVQAINTAGAAVVGAGLSAYSPLIDLGLRLFSRVSLK